MSRPLPPYSGDDATCIKCSNVGARTTYRRFGEPGYGQVGVAANFPERLERECNRCDYRWNEALNPPAHNGPTVRECAEADRNWDVQKAGE